ncbi:stAR-related lipid transfer protein 3-like isoform X2 [Watersipora subatra]
MMERDENTSAAGRIMYGSTIQPNSLERSAVLPPGDPVIQNGMDNAETSIEKSLRKLPMAPLRRTFCLLLAFDVIITVVLWLLFTEVKSKNSDGSEFKVQVLQYDFRTSLFDLLWLSLFRFTILLLAYGLYRSKVPWFVAGTTTCTCIYMICKIVLFTYDLGKDSSLVILDYLELITPIILSWVEVWLMDLKVIPEEKRLVETMLASERRYNRGEFDERAPLLSRFLQPPRTEQSFYSPQPSETGDSDNSDDGRSFHSARASRTHSTTQSITSSTSQGAHYKSVIASAQKIAIDLMESDGWVKESGKDDVEGIVYSKQTKTYGKVFKLVAQVDVDALTYYNDIVECAADMPKWNPTVLEVRRLEEVDDSTEVSYNIAAEGAGGMVSSRDFVCVRHWEQLDGWYITSSMGATHPSMPEQPKYVRGEQGPGVMRLKDVDTNKHQLEWMVNTNLKGWLPQYLIDQALSGVMMSYLKHLRAHAATLVPSSDTPPQ